MTYLTDREREVMADLSTRQREIVALVGRDGLSYKAAARLLGISVHTVREHVRRTSDRVDVPGTRPRDRINMYYWREVHEPEPVEEPEPEPTGFVYVLATTEEPDRLKIGYTNNVENRFKALAAMSPVGLEVVASSPGTIYDERRLHKAVDEFRLHGEWFCAEALPVVLAVAPFGDNGKRDW